MPTTSSVERNPFLFVVGCPRSGTTLLQRMLDHHPQLAVANDTHFIPRAVEKILPAAIEEMIQGRDVPLTSQLVDCVRSYHRFARLGLSDEELQEAVARSTTYQQLVSNLYTTFGRRRGKRLAGEKTPDYVRHLPLLYGMFPRVKTVHIIRDGRDVALSLLDWANERKGPGRFEMWSQQPVAIAAIWWRWQVESGRRAGHRLDSTKYFEIRYEELVNQSEKTLRATMRFLQLPFDSGVLAYHEGKARPNSQLSAKKAWLPPTSGLRNWREQMAERDVELFEAIAGDLLNDLGYTRFVETIPAEIEEIARQVRQWWEKKMAQKIADAERRLAVLGGIKQRQSD